MNPEAIKRKEFLLRKNHGKLLRGKYIGKLSSILNRKADSLNILNLEDSESIYNKFSVDLKDIFEKTNSLKFLEYNSTESTSDQFYKALDSIIKKSKEKGLNIYTDELLLNNDLQKLLTRNGSEKGYLFLGDALMMGGIKITFREFIDNLTELLILDGDTIYFISTKGKHNIYIDAYEEFTGDIMFQSIIIKNKNYCDLL